MNSRHSYVERCFHATAQQVRRHRRLLGHGDVRRARRGDDDASCLFRFFPFCDDQGAGRRVIDRLGGQFPFHFRVNFRAEPRRQDVAFGLPHRFDDEKNLLGSFAFAINHFRHGAADGPVVVDSGETQVLVRHIFQLLERCLWVGLALIYVPQKLF